VSFLFLFCLIAALVGGYLPLINPTNFFLYKMQVAARANAATLARLCLDMGSDAAVTDAHGHSAVSYCMSAGNTELALEVMRAAAAGSPKGAPEGCAKEAPLLAHRLAPQRPQPRLHRKSAISSRTVSWTSYGAPAAHNDMSGFQAAPA
jgi:hypothetical protein